MQNETNHIAAQAALPGAQKPPSAACLWRHLPTAAKCIVMVPVVMALLGAEIELRLSPKLNVILTVAAVWGAWAWLSDNSPAER